MNQREVGTVGEQQAQEYLERKGYRLVESNFQTRYGEIDLIMEDQKALVFVEVKWRKSGKYGDPEEAITPAKISHLTKAAMFYLKSNDLTDKPMRFDVVSFGPSGTHHYKDAFMAGGDYYY